MGAAVGMRGAGEHGGGEVMAKSECQKCGKAWEMAPNVARWGHDHLSDINLSRDRGVKPPVSRAGMCPPLPLWRDGETGANSVGNPGRGVLNMWDTYFVLVIKV